MSRGISHLYRFAAVGLGLLGTGAAIVLAAGNPTPRIIRPPDDRVDFYQTTPALQAIGNSVAAQILTENLTANADGTFTINSGTLSSDFNPLCTGERFGDQPTAASCTATLVGPDVLITAGHCLDDNGTRADLSTIRFVFDYDIKQAGVNPSNFNADQVYRATSILGLANEGATANDWAVVRLDRNVTGRTPVGVRTSGAIAVGQSVVAIGFGAGLPMKFSGNATVQELVDFGFTANLDIVAGNSGGPIINADTNLVEAVLSADMPIDDYHQAGNCFKATVCPGDPGCDGSFTLLASVMTTEFQTTIQNAIGGGGNADADGDGVPDQTDQCPNTPAGTQVDANGCEVVTTSRPPCGAVGIIPLMFLTVGLALLRRR